MPGKKPQNRKKARKTEYLDVIAGKYFIFCEGEKTEPNYFAGFRKAIKEDPIYKNAVIETIGVGAGTLRVIKAAEEYVVKNSIENAQIWCVYDKDSFPDKDFNAVSERATNLNARETSRKKGITYEVAWSNQCVEYWFILHFDFYDSDNDREYYIKYLKKKFKDLDLAPYKKNDKNIFDILTEYGDPKLAIRRAHKRLKSCEDMGLTTDTQCAPATKVYLLVNELAKYLPERIKGKYR